MEIEVRADPELLDQDADVILDLINGCEDAGYTAHDLVHDEDPDRMNAIALLVGFAITMVNPAAIGTLANVLGAAQGMHWICTLIFKSGKEKVVEVPDSSPESLQKVMEAVEPDVTRLVVMIKRV